ncbi:hypothetical protein BCV72DRAFT_313857, partial [Rhizopus microsporus var. microsporus]
NNSYDHTQNIVYTQEGSVKNLINGVDIILSIIRAYSKAFISTMKKIHAYSVHIIQKEMNLAHYPLKNRKS